MTTFDINWRESLKAEFADVAKIALNEALTARSVFANGDVVASSNSTGERFWAISKFGGFAIGGYVSNDATDKSAAELLATLPALHGESLTTLPSIDWTHVAPVWKWLAQDADGALFLFRSMPYIAGPESAIWSRGDDFGVQAASCFASARKGYGNWRLMAVERPPVDAQSVAVRVEGGTSAGLREEADARLTRIRAAAAAAASFPLKQ